MSDLKIPPEEQFDFSEWRWGNIIDRLPELVEGIEEAFRTTLDENFPVMLSKDGPDNEEPLSIGVGLPFESRAGNWIWATVPLADLVDDYINAYNHRPELGHVEKAAAELREMAEKVEQLAARLRAMPE
jgi:hypothetical protein